MTLQTAVKKRRGAAAPKPTSTPARDDTPAEHDARDTSRLGTAAEHLVAASCVIASDFRLNVSTAMVDDEGVDLVFHRRGCVATMAVQVKARAAKTLGSGNFTHEVRSSTFHPRENLFVLFVVVDTKSVTFGPVWLVPSSELASKVAPDKKDRLRFSASRKDGTRDQWHHLRMDRSQLADKILDVLDELERRLRGPSR